MESWAIVAGQSLRGNSGNVLGTKVGFVPQFQFTSAPGVTRVSGPRISRPKASLSQKHSETTSILVVLEVHLLLSPSDGCKRNMLGQPVDPLTFEVAQKTTSL